MGGGVGVWGLAKIAAYQGRFVFGLSFYTERGWEKNYPGSAGGQFIHLYNMRGIIVFGSAVSRPLPASTKPSQT
jgi:hypothetical protein